MTLLLLALVPHPGSPAPGEVDEPMIHRSTPDPDRRADLEDWWRRFEAIEPTLKQAGRGLRGVRDRWRSTPRREGCRQAREELAAVDRLDLLEGAEYPILVEMATALDEFDGAVAACLEHRYFEFEYRLWLAESGVRRLRDRVAARLAFERRRRAAGRPPV